MLMYTTLDPRELDPKKVSHEAYKHQVQDFFHGIEENTMILGDPEGVLGNELLQAVIDLPASCAEAKVAWADRQKDKKKWPIRCRRDVFGPVQNKEVRWILKRLKTCCPLDDIFSSDEKVNGSSQLSSYRESDFERRRRKLARPSAPLDSLPKEEVDDYFIRAIRFAKWIRFYDKQLGSADGITRFSKGIDYVLSLWQKHGQFADDPGNTVTFYTVEKEKLDQAPDSRVRESYLERNLKARAKLERELVVKLRKKFPWQIGLVIKADADHISHGRHFEAQGAIIRIERGFDMFDDQGKFKRNQLSVDNNFADHLREYRDLPDAVYE